MEKTFIFTELERTDLRQGIAIAMKELDKHAVGTDRKLSDRLEVIFNKVSDWDIKK